MMAEPDEALSASDQQPKDGKPSGEEAQLQRFKRWYRVDDAHCSKWRPEAKKDYDFHAGHHWDDKEKADYDDMDKMFVVFNRVLPIIKSVAGTEINNRQEIFYYPRGVEDSAINEVLTNGSRWMADQCDAEDEESEAFEDVVICGMGWTETRLDFDDDPEGVYIEERINPLEMRWDASARKRNLIDSKRRWRVRSMPLEDARALFPDVEDDDDLDATWAIGGLEDSEPGTPVEERRERMSGLSTDLEDFYLKKVTIVHLQWMEKQTYYRVLGLDPNDPARLVEVDEDEFKEIEKAAKKVGGKLESAKHSRNVYRQAFIGGKILKQGDVPAQGHFSFQCITGERDHNKGHFFGLVRVMRDPQKYANKWLSDTLNLLSTASKGGLMAERGAFEDDREAEASWAHNDQITFLRKGALSGPNGARVKEKPQAQFPAGYYQLMEFALSSIRDTSGVNLELLGLRDANQPGILEAQRKQAAMTILATLFNALRRFRKQIGRIRLYYLQTYFADNRLIRVSGPNSAKAVKLSKDQMVGKYDVVIDDSPMSPNQKEQVWASATMMFPVLKDMLTPEIVIALLEYSPLPSSVVQDIKNAAAQAKPDPQKQAMLQAELKKLIGEAAAQMAKAQKDQSDAALNAAETAKTQAETKQIEAETTIEVATAIAATNAPPAPPTPMGA